MPAIETDAEITAQIRAYEDLHGLLTEQERISIKIARRQESAAKPVARHPLGHDANPSEDQTTAPNRRALKDCLRAFWGGTLGETMTQTRTTVTGVALADRFVTFLELAFVLREQRRDHPEGILLVERRFRDGWTVDQVCQADHCEKSAYYVREAIAIDAMIVVIWSDWTEAKSQEMSGERL